MIGQWSVYLILVMFKVINLQITFVFTKNKILLFQIDRVLWNQTINLICKCHCIKLNQTGEYPVLDQSIIHIRARMSWINMCFLSCADPTTNSSQQFILLALCFHSFIETPLCTESPLWRTFREKPERKKENKQANFLPRTITATSCGLDLRRGFQTFLFCFTAFSSSASQTNRWMGNSAASLRGQGLTEAAGELVHTCIQQPDT